jgi:acyl-CoA thioester hydrolase
MTIDFASPARMDDEVRIETTITGLGGARIEMAQVLRRDGVILCSAGVTLGFLVKGRPARMPGAMRSALVALHKT